MSKTKSAGICSRGATAYLRNGMKHSKLTRVMEGLDNSQKATSGETPIIVYNIVTPDGSELIANIDFGCGIKNIDESICLFNIDADSKNGNDNISKCGMGLNTLISTSIENGSGLIFTTRLNSKNKQEKEYKEFIIEEELTYKDIQECELQKELENLLIITKEKYDVESETGTIIILKNNQPIDTDSNSDLLYLQKIIKNEDESICIKEIDEDNDNLVEYLELLLSESPLQYYYNNKELIKSKPYNDKDKIIIDLCVYLNKDDSNFTLYFENTNLSIVKNGSGIQQAKETKGIIYDDDYIKKHNLLYLGNYTFYKLINLPKDKLRSKIYYNIKNIRCIGSKDISNTDISVNNNNYLLGSFNFIDSEWVKTQLSGQKTDSNPRNINIVEDFNILHRMLSKIMTSQEILQLNGCNFGYSPIENSQGNKDKYKKHYFNADVKDKKPTTESHINQETNLYDGSKPYAGGSKPSSSKPSAGGSKPSAGGSKPSAGDSKPSAGGSKPFSSNLVSSSIPSNESKKIKKDKRSLHTAGQKNILLKQDSLCNICKIKIDDLHIFRDFDHIKEHSKGGETSESNIQALCVNCHRGKQLEWAEKDNKSKTKEHIKIMIEYYTNALNLFED